MTMFLKPALSQHYEIKPNAYTYICIPHASLYKGYVR